MHTTQHMRHGLHRLADSFADGWDNLAKHAEHALTQFTDHAHDTVVAVHRGKSIPRTVSRSWGLLASDLHEDTQRYHLRLELPGLRAQDIDVCIDDGELVVSGRKPGRSDEIAGELLIAECAYGHFQRRYPLQREVSAEQAEASYRDGVLELVLPKAAPSQSRQVPINPG